MTIFHVLKYPTNNDAQLALIPQWIYKKWATDPRFENTNYGFNDAAAAGARNLKLLKQILLELEDDES